MRGIAACLVGLVGLGALATMAACSDSTDSGSGGVGGTPATAGAGGKANSGGSSNNGGSGGGSLECGFAKDSCNECLTSKCADEMNACSDAGNCLADLLALPNCVCNPANDTEM